MLDELERTNCIKRPEKRLLSAKAMLLPAVLLVLLTGCGEDKSAVTGAATAAASGMVAIPDEVKATKQLLDVAVLTSLTRANPFLSQLPQPELPMPDPSLPDGSAGTDPNVVTAPPPADPYEGFNLNGILYRGKKSQAILALPDGKTKIVRVGDRFQTEADPSIEIKVAKIDKTAVKLQVIHPPADYPAEYKTKTYEIPRLVGYQSKSSSASKKTSAGATAPGTAVPPDMGQGASSGAIPQGVQNALGGQAINQINSAFSGAGTPPGPATPPPPPVTPR